MAFQFTFCWNFVRLCFIIFCLLEIFPFLVPNCHQQWIRWKRFHFVKIEIWVRKGDVYTVLLVWILIMTHSQWRISLLRICRDDKKRKERFLHNKIYRFLRLFCVAIFILKFNTARTNTQEWKNIPPRILKLFLKILLSITGVENVWLAIENSLNRFNIYSVTRGQIFSGRVEPVQNSQVFGPQLNRFNILRAFRL